MNTLSKRFSAAFQSDLPPVSSATSYVTNANFSTAEGKLASRDAYLLQRADISCQNHRYQARQEVDHFFVVRNVSSCRSAPCLQLPYWYSPLTTKKEPRIVPASLDLCLANLNFPSSSVGTFIPSESLKPTARFFGSLIAYITLTTRPLP